MVLVQIPCQVCSSPNKHDCSVLGFTKQAPITAVLRTVWKSFPTSVDADSCWCSVQCITATTDGFTLLNCAIIPLVSSSRLHHLHRQSHFFPVSLQSWMHLKVWTLCWSVRCRVMMCYQCLSLKIWVIDPLVVQAVEKHWFNLIHFILSGTQKS